MVPPLDTMSNAALIAGSQTTLLSRFSRHLQALPTPESISSIKTNSMPFTLKQLRDPTVAESRMLANEFQHSCDDARFIVRPLRFVTLRTPMLTSNVACTPLTDFELCLQMLHRFTLARRAYQFPEASS